MGSSKNQNNLKKPRISNKTLDKKADSNLVSILKQSFNQLEIENKELHRYNRELQNRLNVGINLYKELKKENKELKAQIKEWEIEKEEVFQECVKLKDLVEKLREAIEEPKELDDK
jgi:chromosome segregation ATPase